MSGIVERTSRAVHCLYNDFNLFWIRRHTSIVSAHRHSGSFSIRDTAPPAAPLTVEDRAYAAPDTSAADRAAPIEIVVSISTSP